MARLASVISFRARFPKSFSCVRWTHTNVLSSAILQGDRAHLARAITLVESRHPKHQKDAQELLSSVLVSEQFFSRSSKSLRIGISGPPGAGKSTFIEALGVFLLNRGHKVAVLAVDPSSARTGGSLLGDKTRMTELSRHPNAYVRPSPTRGTLGGIGQATSDAITLCEGAGYDTVIVETVGVGQSEFAVSDVVDMLILLVTPTSGDELQGMKKGIMEMCDLLVVNKADGDLHGAARHLKVDFANALRLSRPRWDNWTPKAIMCSSIRNGDDDIAEIWRLVEEFHKVMKESNQIQKYRSSQRVHWMWLQVQESVMQHIRQQQKSSPLVKELEAKLRGNSISSRQATLEICRMFLKEVSDSNK